jgi:hypothetical protein
MTGAMSFACWGVERRIAKVFWERKNTVKADLAMPGRTPSAKGAGRVVGNERIGTCGQRVQGEISGSIPA